MPELNSEDKEFIRDMIETFVISFVVLMVIYRFVAFPEIVVGASMEPVIESNDRILVERVSKHFTQFERGQVIVLNPPGDDNVDYVKRIIGLPNEIVKIQDCQIYISKDGQRTILQEPYIAPEICTKGNIAAKEGRALKLKDNQYFVLGDNRDHSADSRVFGVVTHDRILGKVVFRFWPFDDFGFLN